jgi:hypothetical protein
MTIECVWGPWDGKRVADHGEEFRVASFSGAYVRFGRVYRWQTEIST